MCGKRIARAAGRSPPEDTCPFVAFALTAPLPTGSDRSTKPVARWAAAGLAHELLPRASDPESSGDAVPAESSAACRTARGTGAVPPVSAEERTASERM